jgi:site-specific DNA-methyltransferase (adenine-specific)
MKFNQKRFVDLQRCVVGNVNCNNCFGGISMDKYLDSIIHGKCVEVMTDWPAEIIDLVHTSPPYDALRHYHGYKFDVKAVAEQLYRVLKPGGLVVWIVADQTIKGSKTGSSHRHVLTFQDCGFRLHDTMIYEKNGIRYPDKVRYYNCFEYMFVFSKGRPETTKLIRDRENVTAGQMQSWTERERDGSLTKRAKKKIAAPFGVRRNIWPYHTGSHHTAPDNLWRSHPAVFPLQLAEDHIISWTRPGDIVLDPMCGSGQTLLAALINERHYIGIDCSAEYCRLARERLALYQDCLWDEYFEERQKREDDLTSPQ